MRRLVFMLMIMALLAACRGEPVPRDYQNAPPGMTHPPHTKSDTPAQHGMGQASPEPDKGVAGTAAPNQPTSATDTSTTTIGDTPPVTTTT